MHAAGVIHPASMDEFEQVNHVGTANVLAGAEAGGVRRMVHVSSNSPFGTNPERRDSFRNDEPYHPYLGYGRSKMEAELRVLEAADRGLDVVMVRPPWFYGPHQPARQTTFFTLVRTGRFPVFGDGGSAPLDGLHRQPRRRHRAGRADPDRRRPRLVDRRCASLHGDRDRRDGRARAHRRGLRRRQAEPVPPPRVRRRHRRDGSTASCRVPAATCSSCTCSAR